jgi:hypothetical protein
MLKRYTGGNLGGDIWFRDDYFDLVLQLDGDGMLRSYSLSYNWNSTAPKHIRWSTKHGATHSGVDYGEGQELRWKGTPILVQSTVQADEELPEIFRLRSHNLPNLLAEQLYESLQKVIRPLRAGENGLDC